MTIRFLLLTACVSLSPYGSLCADESKYRVLEYTITSDDLLIGTLKQKLSRQGEKYRFVEQSRIEVSGWWGDVDISGITIEDFSHSSTLSGADSRIIDGDTLYWTHIHRSGSNLIATYSEIKRTEKSVLKVLKQQISRSFKQSFDLTIDSIMETMESLFDNSNVQPQIAGFNIMQFDTTANTLPFYLQGLAGKAVPNTLRILNTEDLEIELVNIRDFGYEMLLAGKIKINSRHLRLIHDRQESADIWINDEIGGLPYLVRFIGRDEDGLVEVELR